MSLTFRGVHAEILEDLTPERDVEGSLNCGKTTVCLWAELNALEKYPGIWTLLTRYSTDAVDTKLRPAFEQLCQIRELTPHWDDKKKFYQCENGSRAYAFGLKAVSLVERYEKIRGLPVSRIFVDQAEALPADIAGELRARLRPDIIAQSRGQVFPTQLTFSANPVNDDHWLAKQFPITNTLKRRKYFCVALTDNAHNLPTDTVEGMLQAYPPEHPKHITVILGQRGLNVIGEPIYEGLFDRALHIRPVSLRDEDAPLLEAYEVGKHNPVWLLARRTYAGGWHFLGGILGRGLVLEDFLPIVERYRAQWYPALQPGRLLSCTAPMGDKHSAVGARFTLLQLLRARKIRLQWRDNGNAPDVRLAMIEYLASQLRKRTADREEAIGVEQHPARWLMATREGVTEKPFLAFAFEGGYTWSDHFVSVSHDELRQPTEDDEFANVMHCAEQIVLNFGADQQSQRDRDLATAAATQRSDAMPMDGGSLAWLGW